MRDEPGRRQAQGDGRGRGRGGCRCRRRWRRGLLALPLAAVCLFTAIVFWLSQGGGEVPEVGETEEDLAADALTVQTETEEVPVVVLDAGHGGKDPGCSYWGAEEKDLTLAIVLKAAALLEEAGYEVVMTRDDDSWVEKADRVALAAENDADLFISVHLNALEEDTETCGIETYCNETACAGSAALAEALQNCVVAATGGKDRQVVTDSEFYVVHHATVPACLLEAGFLTSEEEGALLQDEGYQACIALGILAAVEQILEI